MPERWRRELRKLSSASPSDELYRRAQQGPRRELEPERRRSGVIAVAAVLAVCTAAALLSWRAFGRTDDDGQAIAPSSGPPSSTSEPPAATGYFIRFAAQAEADPNGFDATVTAATNLPEGTRVEISTTDQGSCCPQVSGGQIVVETQNSSCFGRVGDSANSPGFDATITARPDLDTLVVPGPMLPGEGGSGIRNEQPESVQKVLGPHFERLTGEQVVVQDDGSKWLVATAHFKWPEPQCGGDPFPLFGGTATQCQDGDVDAGGQLQGDVLAQAMSEVMGAIGQARMCEFYASFLPPDVEAEHPWPEFAAEWRKWLLRQDFSDLDGSGDWETGPLHWEEASRHGDVHVIDVVHDGERIAGLEVRPLPDYCPDCNKSVVPFWGVTAWTLL